MSAVGGSQLVLIVSAPPGDGNGAGLPQQIPGTLHHQPLLLRSLREPGEITQRSEYYQDAVICADMPYSYNARRMHVNMLQ